MHVIRPDKPRLLDLLSGIPFGIRPRFATTDALAAD